MAELYKPVHTVQFREQLVNAVLVHATDYQSVFIGFFAGKRHGEFRQFTFVANVLAYTAVHCGQISRDCAWNFDFISFFQHEFSLPKVHRYVHLLVHPVVAVYFPVGDNPRSGVAGALSGPPSRPFAFGSRHPEDVRVRGVLVFPLTTYCRFAVGFMAGILDLSEKPINFYTFLTRPDADNITVW